MLETLLPETREILGHLHNETGARIRLVPAEAAYLSRAKLSARKSNQITIAYNPHTESIDYAVAHEAIRYLRFRQAAPEDRFLLAGDAETRMRAFRAVEKEIERQPWAIREYTLRAFDNLYEGILIRLVSTPGEFWINHFLKEAFPAFEGEMRKGLDAIFERAHQNLGEDLEKISPPTIYRATNAMNAALANFLGELLSNENYGAPYAGPSFGNLGKTLRLMNNEDRGHAGDMEAADKWAALLGLRGWYKWIKM